MVTGTITFGDLGINTGYKSWDSGIFLVFELDKYMVDFLLSHGSKIWPIEVKSSGYKTHASLYAFCKKFPERISNRYLVYTKDSRKEEATTLLPLFMRMFL